MTLKAIVGQFFFAKNNLYLKNPYYTSTLLIGPDGIIFKLGGNHRLL